MRSYFPPQFASTSAWRNYGPYPYTYPVAGGASYPYAYPVAGGSYPYSSPMTGESYPYPVAGWSYPNGEPYASSAGSPFFHPWNMYTNFVQQPWTMPQVSWNHATTPMVPPHPPTYQTEPEQPKPVWDSPESPQSPWLKAYRKKEQAEK
jgi:hypothetical protein